ncbi:MAG: twin-arginine translocase TatA/TatE family subunit [Deltaproteobacteria bacterium]
MFGLGTTELILILIIILVLFGAGKLPEIGSSLGKAIKSFKNASSDSTADTTASEEEKKKLKEESGKSKKA